jgi:ATP-dependent Zn protease
MNDDERTLSKYALIRDFFIRLPKVSRKISRKLTQREVTAYHEAGHAVVGACFGYLPETITITPNADTLGFTGGTPLMLFLTRSDEKAVGLDRARIEYLVVSVTAGIIAEKMVTRRVDHKKASGDYKRAFELLEQYLVDDLDELVQRFKLLANCARDILECIWPAVAQVAEALIEHETLNSEAFAAIFLDKKSPSYTAEALEVSFKWLDGAAKPRGRTRG